MIMEWALILEIPSLSSSFPELTKFYAEHRSIVCAIQEVGGTSGSSSSRQSEYIYLNEFWETEWCESGLDFHKDLTKKIGGGGGGGICLIFVG